MPGSCFTGEPGGALGEPQPSPGRQGVTSGCGTRGARTVRAPPAGRGRVSLTLPAHRGPPRRAQTEVRPGVGGTRRGREAGFTARLRRRQETQREAPGQVLPGLLGETKPSPILTWSRDERKGSQGSPGPPEGTRREFAPPSPILCRWAGWLGPCPALPGQFYARVRGRTWGKEGIRGPRARRPGRGFCRLAPSGAGRCAAGSVRLGTARHGSRGRPDPSR